MAVENRLPATYDAILADEVMSKAPTSGFGTFRAWLGRRPMSVSEWHADIVLMYPLGMAACGAELPFTSMSVPGGGTKVGIRDPRNGHLQHFLISQFQPRNRTVLLPEFACRQLTHR